MEHKTTLKELAKILNVSVSTVSKALNDSHGIGEKTRARIKEVALQHNYVPNGLAQSLQSRRTKTIGVIIPDILAHFFAKSLHGIETTASKLGYKIIICISNESRQKEAESIKTLVNGSVDGIIMSLARETQAVQDFEHFTQAIKHSIPIVLFDRISQIPSCDTVTINDTEVTANVTQKLITSGCKNMVYLTSIFNTSVDQRRQEGYFSTMSKNELQPHVIHIENYKTFEKHLLQFLEATPVDGIIAADELSAVSAMKIVLKNGYRIPEDISVIGFTNGILGENFIPSLSTVDQHAEEQGQLAIETVVERIEKKSASGPQHKIIQTSLIYRDSTKPIYAK